MAWNGDGLTNLYRIEGVLFISWTTFHAPGVSLELDGQHAVLGEAALDLHHRGLLAHAQRNKGLLWHFVLHEPTGERDNLPDQTGTVTETAAKYGLKMYGSGSLRAADLPDAVYAPATPSENDRPGGDMGGPVGQQQVPAEDASKSLHDKVQIYVALQHALVDTIMHWILQSGRWMQFDATTILLPELAASTNVNGLADTDGLPTARIHSLWHRDGALLVILHHHLQVHRLTSDLHAPDVCLAPLGLEGRVVGPGQDSRLDAQPDVWKRYFVDWLKSRSVDLVRPDAWICVALYASGPARTILWPQELCFTSAGDVSAMDLDDSDPLLDSESWLANADERVQRLKIQRHEQPQNAQLNKALSADDAMMRLLRRGESALSAQAVMGIYPTPPDGPRGSHSANFHDETENPRIVEGGELTAQIPPEQHDMPGIKVSMHGYGTDDDELFGHSGGAMFQDNGITEDDFSFFDEPDQTPQDVFDRPLPEVDSSKNNGVAQSDIPNYLDEPETTDKGANQENGIPNGQSPSSEASEVVPEKLEAMDVDKDAEATSTTIPTNKYGVLGKFASQVSVLPTTIRPSRSPERGQLIPRLKEEDKEDLEMYSSASTPSETGRVTPFETDNGVSTNNVPGSSSRDPLSNQTTCKESPDLLLHTLERAASEYTPSNTTTNPRKLPEKADATVRLGQILADQGVQYYHSFGANPQRTGYDQALDPAFEIIQSVLPNSTRCSVDQCGILTAPYKLSNKIKPIRHTMRKQNHQRIRSETDPHHFKLDPPQFRTKRGARALDVSLYALRFWEELGLSPYWGPKDVTAFFLYPDIELVHRGAASFMEAIGSTYMSLRLGLHKSGNAQEGEVTNGLWAVPSTKDADGEVYDRIGRNLQTYASENTTIVLYMVNQSETFTELKQLCLSFLRVFDAYASGLRSPTNPSDLVLKVLPGSAIASRESLTIPSVNELIRIAKELYDRCPSTVAEVSPYASLSLVQLTPDMPHGVDFKLSLENPSTLLQQDSVAHLAYCWDAKCLWLTAAITDTLGCHCWSGAFLVGGSPDTMPTFRAIAREILNIAIEALEAPHGRPRVLITQDRHVSSSEVDVWMSLARSHEISIAIVRLDTNPPLQIFPHEHPAADPIPPPSFAGAADLVSPELTAPRAAEEAETRARLLDPGEEVFGATTSCTIGVSPESLLLIPSLGSGYLYKPSGVLMSLSIVQAENYDLHIRDLLKMSYDLTCLSRARGSPSEVPWHIAVAREAHNTLHDWGL